MTPPLELWKMRPDDVALLEDVDPRIAANPAQRDHFADLLGCGMSWAALAARRPVGFVLVTRHFFNYPFVDLIVVAESRRRLGVGRALMLHCERVHDADRIFTSTNESNAPMRALLAQLGWRPCGQVDALDEGDPELFFVKFRDR